MACDGAESPDLDDDDLEVVSSVERGLASPHAAAATVGVLLSGPSCTVRERPTCWSKSSPLSPISKVTSYCASPEASTCRAHAGRVHGSACMAACRGVQGRAGACRGVQRRAGCSGLHRIAGALQRTSISETSMPWL